MMGADGIWVISCRANNNTAGRIGDDTRSGNIITVEVNGKLIKARCK